MKHTNIILEVKQLIKNYGKLRAVDNITFSIKEGICFGLLGPNGAGKTTALETIENITKPTSGEILYRGKPRAESFHEKVGIQFQETALLSLMTVKETLEVFHALYSEPDTLDKTITLCNLNEILNRDNSKISGGQKQRLLLALAMINNPDIIFLDEPSTGMDPQNRRNMWDIINSIKEQRKTIVLTTHYMEEAEYLCDDLAILDHGKIIAQGSPEKLIKEHAKGVTITLPAQNINVPYEAISNNFYEINGYVEIQTDNINSMINKLVDYNINLEDMVVHSPNLEDVFIHLTGKKLRE